MSGDEPKAPSAPHWSEAKGRSPGAILEPAGAVDHAATFGVPCLRLLPGEREKFEAEARRLRGTFGSATPDRGEGHWNRRVPSGELRTWGAR